MKDEPLLKENPGRFTLFPIENSEVSPLAKQVRHSNSSVGALARTARFGLQGPPATIYPFPSRSFYSCIIAREVWAIEPRKQADNSGLEFCNHVQIQLFLLIFNANANLASQVWEMYKKAQASFWTAEEIVSLDAQGRNLFAFNDL